MRDQGRGPHYRGGRDNPNHGNSAINTESGGGAPAKLEKKEGIPKKERMIYHNEGTGDPRSFTN